MEFLHCKGIFGFQGQGGGLKVGSVFLIKGQNFERNLGIWEPGSQCDSVHRIKESKIKNKKKKDS